MNKLNAGALAGMTEPNRAATSNSVNALMNGVAMSVFVLRSPQGLSEPFYLYYGTKNDCRGQQKKKQRVTLVGNPISFDNK